MRIRDVLFVALVSAPAVAQASWSQLYPALTPPERRDAVMDCHEATGSVLMLFGNNSGGYLQDCWRLDGTSWSQVAGPLPPPRTAAAMVYDSVRQRLVLFGGTAQGGRLQDTWEWNGTSWSSPLLAVMPPARSGHAMAFDRLRGVTVLSGGFVNGGILGMADDVWEWNGAVWQQRTPPQSLGPRALAVMAFDPVRQEVLLHGGSVPIATGTLPRNDTWSWNGVQWQQQFPLTPPPFRFSARAVTDQRRARIVLQGGGTDPFAWEWDGAQWNIVLQASPSGRSDHVMAFDSAAQRVVLWGGLLGVGGSTFLDDTWVYRTPLPASVTAFGSGCAGSAGTPSLANVPYHLPWLGDTVTNRVDHIAPGEIGALFVSSFGSMPPFDLGLLGMTGCDLLVPLDILEFAPANGGAADWSYAVPVSLALAGVAFRQQAFPFDAAANPFGLGASNGVEATFGVR